MRALPAQYAIANNTNGVEGYLFDARVQKTLTLLRRGQHLDKIPLTVGSAINLDSLTRLSGSLNEMLPADSYDGGAPVLKVTMQIADAHDLIRIITFLNMSAPRR